MVTLSAVQGLLLRFSSSVQVNLGTSCSNQHFCLQRWKSDAQKKKPETASKISRLEFRLKLDGLQSDVAIESL